MNKSICQKIFFPLPILPQPVDVIVGVLPEAVSAHEPTRAGKRYSALPAKIYSVPLLVPDIPGDECISKGFLAGFDVLPPSPGG